MPSDDIPQICRVCDNESGNKLHHAREMFFGTRDTFTYVECAACGTLQIQEVPDLRRYYTADYYSFQFSTPRETPTGLGDRLKRLVGAFLRQNAADYYCRRRNFLNSFVYQQVLQRAPQLLVGFPAYINESGCDLRIDRQSRILDVGSGAGHILFSLAHFGFKNLLGIDPFATADSDHPSGVVIRKAEMDQLTGEFDLILANHTIEHVTEPGQSLESIYELLKPGRYAIVRMPVVADAWRHYGTDWVQLDAPRHLFIFSVTGFTQLATERGFMVEQVSYDSTAFQFWGSEQYRQDIPLMDERSYFVNPSRSIFTTQQIDDFTIQAAQLNATTKGDQAVFYLRKE